MAEQRISATIPNTSSHYHGACVMCRVQAEGPRERPPPALREPVRQATDGAPGCRFKSQASSPSPPSSLRPGLGARAASASSAAWFKAISLPLWRPQRTPGSGAVRTLPDGQTDAGALGAERGEEGGAGAAARASWRVSTEPRSSSPTGG